jgi:glutamate dehydrogenase
MTRSQLTRSAYPEMHDPRQGAMMGSVSLVEETEAGSGRPEDRLPAQIAERAGGDRRDAVRAFAHAYLRRVSGDGSDGISDEDLTAEVLAAFAFASGRGTTPVAVRALSPTREGHGYEPLGSVLETNTDDLPFLVDSVTAEVEAHGLTVVRLRHPIVGVQRAANGRIEAIQHPRDASRRESVMHFDLDRRLDAEELRELEDGVRRVLEAVRTVVRDFPAMSARVKDMAKLAKEGADRYPADEVREVENFLAWLLQGNFVLLGAREYDFSSGAIGVVDGSGLGMLADEERSAFAEPVSLDALPPAMRERATSGDLLLVSKTNAVSPVHRRERMDYVGVRRAGPDGTLVGESRLLGLFTTKAYAEPASETPVLHRKLRQALAVEDLIEGSHDYKAAVAVFDSFPKDELFVAPVEDLHRAVVALMELEGSDRVRLLGRRDPDGRSASLIVSLPRERYDTRLVERIQELLEARFATHAITTHHVLQEGERARVHFSLHAADGLPLVSLFELEAEVVQLARTWDDLLREVLCERHGSVGGRVLAEGWAHHFPDHYKGYTHPALAAHDIACFERLQAGEAFVVSLQVIPRAEETRVALYKRGAKVELSQAMPMLEDLGLRVMEEIATRLVEVDETWVQEFRVLGADGASIDIEAAGERVAETIAAVHRGDAESDALNRLVISAGLDRHQLAFLRAYRKYRQRVGSRFTESYQNEVLAANPLITAKLVRYFELRFDPARERDVAAEEALREEILADLEDVVSLDHDRILGNQLAVIDATLRTNVYREGRSALAFKLRSPDVPVMPQPAPEYEIYVYSPQMEGIHLRGAKIARGGIRWSDRMDYRTEVYGLMRAQLTKNAIIVPAGAKGGFILKSPPAGREELKAEVERQYVAYIRSLLDLTDNLVDGEVVHPAGVRVLDEDDTYLVVAADKGTATFSDLANSVAQESGFWLDDAFASGGSSGYDHKKLGITARGAWESVKRHFRALDLDPARDEFTVVGIGDMSGDVFGNGMLLSDKIRLVAAYDHRHVFIDPDPDAAASFAERKRLFELAGSSWDDYDRDLISEGGGVWPRAAKSIPLSEQARAALGIEDERLTPTDVIRAILRAPVDLLWNGGIGTVVKASTQSDADAADRASDAIRVNGRELRARVVGEGGNLGFTRRARVEYAAAGGLINADFIDNSAGVDCSDHEVNVKVLLGLAERAGEMTREERDVVLVAATDDVVEHVLYDSFLQAQIIAQEVERSAGRMFAYEDLMALLEENGMLDRASEDLPTSDEIAERRRARRGLERPELATLLAYAKRWVTRELVSSDYLDDPWLQRDLRDYFPAPVLERVGEHVDQHPLRRQLLAMIGANSVVNSLGPTFVSQLVAERGADVASVVRAFRIAREVVDAAALWDPVEQLQDVGRTAQAELMAGIDALVEATTRWYAAWPPAGSLGEVIDAGRSGFERYAAVLGELADEDELRRREETERRLVAAGVSEAMAREHAQRQELVHAPDVIRAAAVSGRPIEEVARVFFALGSELSLDWLERELDRVRSSTRMQRWALQAVREDAFQARREVTEQALRGADGLPPEAAVARFVEGHAESVNRLAGLLRALAREDEPDLAGLTLAVRQLRALTG